MSARRRSGLIASVSLALCLTACATGGDEGPPPYLESRLLPPLRVPEDLSRPRAAGDPVTLAPAGDVAGQGTPPADLEIPPGFSNTD